MVLCKTMYTLISIYLWGRFVSSQCFFPDGTPTKDAYGQDGFYPCNSTTGGQASSCCQLTTSACTTEGYCIGNNGYAYRGACTDSSFPMPCPQYCLNVERSTFSPLFPCGVEGRFSNSFCCGLSWPYSCCNDEIFSAGIIGNPFVPLSYAEAHEPALSSTTSSSSLSTAIVNATTFPTLASSSSSASTTISDTPTIPPPSASHATSSPINQSSSSSSSSHSIAIGAGVGVPFGVALLLGLGLLFYREHKQRLKLESLLKDNLPLGKHEKVSQAPVMNGILHELSGNYYNELGGNPIHEANETN